jgi:hypothetical protein
MLRDVVTEPSVTEAVAAEINLATGVKSFAGAVGGALAPLALLPAGQYSLDAHATIAEPPVQKLPIGHRVHAEIDVALDVVPYVPGGHNTGFTLPAMQ